MTAFHGRTWEKLYLLPTSSEFERKFSNIYLRSSHLSSEWAKASSQYIVMKTNYGQFDFELNLELLFCTDILTFIH